MAGRLGGLAKWGGNFCLKISHRVLPPLRKIRGEKLYDREEWSKKADIPQRLLFQNCQDSSSWRMFNQLENLGFGNTHSQSYIYITKSLKWAFLHPKLKKGKVQHNTDTRLWIRYEILSLKLQRKHQIMSSFTFIHFRRTTLICYNSRYVLKSLKR